MGYELGFTSNDKGFHVRIEEQEKTNWAKSMIFLSCDVAQVMTFLELDPERYNQGFTTEKEVFNWITTTNIACKFLRPGEESDDGSVIGNQPVAKDKAEHKRRMEVRPMFARFITDILPTLELVQVDVATARKAFLSRALQFFNKKVEYDTRIELVHSENDDEKGRLALVGHVAQVTNLKKDQVNEITRAVRRWVMVSHTEPPTLSLREQAVPDGEPGLNLGRLVCSGGPALHPVVEEWISANWERTRRLERDRVQDKKRMESFLETLGSNEEASWQRTRGVKKEGK